MTSIFAALSSRIQEILYEYVKIQSFTNTPKERLVEDFFTGRFEQIAYFREHPELWGLYPVEGDPLKRNICWAMVKGKGSKTVALVHHYDIVDIEDFKTLKPFAFSPDQLSKELAKHLDLLPEDARKDLEAGTFLFCRGGCDMKAGGSIQYALMEAYSQMEDFEGMSSSWACPMRKTCPRVCGARQKLLAELKKEYGLEYLMMINSEPHQRKDFSRESFPKAPWAR